MTDVDVVIVRQGRNLRGRLLGAFLGIVGKGQLEKWFAKTLKAIEERNYKISVAAKAGQNGATSGFSSPRRSASADHSATGNITESVTNAISCFLRRDKWSARS